jgi:hypothetical protein
MTTINFWCPRREETTECKVCGEKIHAFHGDGPPLTFDYDHPGNEWFDGTGHSSATSFVKALVTEGNVTSYGKGVWMTHEHLPALVEGPTIQLPGKGVQITYNMVYDEEQNTLAWLDEGRNGDWVIAKGEHVNESYSDFWVGTES